MEIEITIDRKFLEDYRKYKIDLTFGKCDIDMEYEILSHVLENSEHNLSSIIGNLEEDDDTITINKKTVTSKSIKAENKRQIEAMKKMFSKI